MPMQIYTPLNLAGFELVQPIDGADYEVFSGLDGTSRKDGWIPVRVRLIEVGDRGEELEDSDAPWLGTASALILKRRAVEALGPIWETYGECLPLECKTADLYVFNPTRCLDALDEEASVVHRLLPSGRIVQIERHVFRPEVVDDVDLFKITSLRVSPTYVSQRFADHWRSTELRGLQFVPVWPEAAKPGQMGARPRKKRPARG